MPFPHQRPPAVTPEERALAKAMARVREGVLALDELAYLGEARRTIRYLAEENMTVAAIGRPCAFCGHTVADHRTHDGSCGGCGYRCYAYEVPA